MKVIRLVAALCVTLCAATRANVIVDIYQDQYMDPIQSGYQFPKGTFNELAGSFEVQTPSWTPAPLNFNVETHDWHPFGLTWYMADMHGTFQVETPGTSHFDFNRVGSLSFGEWTIDGEVIYRGDAFESQHHDGNVTLGVGQHTFDIKYRPGMRDQQYGPNPWDHGVIPYDYDGFALIDNDNTWAPAVSVPESGAWCWLAVPLVLLARRLMRKMAAY